MRYRIVVRRHGVSGGRPGPGGNPGKRNIGSGWSKSAASANSKWLQSVVPPDCYGIALTLTIKEMPTPDKWRSYLENFNQFLSRHKLIDSYHFVVEWQKRGHPHVHYMIYLHIQDSAFPDWSVIFRQRWVNITANAVMVSQYAKAVVDVRGWLEYVAKHAARGMYHYQRSGMPDAWKGQSTGRMWGYGGSWQAKKEAKVSLSESDFVCFSRLLRTYMKKQGRRKQKRNLFFTKDKIYPSGISEWVSHDAVLRMLEFVVTRNKTSDLVLIED